MPDKNVKVDQAHYVTQFWNAAFAKSAVKDDQVPRSISSADRIDPFERRFLELIGDVSGREILEIGCGLGDYTVAFAKMGAYVTSVDISAVAVEKVRQRLSAAGLTADVQVMNVFDIKCLNRRFDLIAGKFILHHLEPFEELSAIFAACLKPEGKMVFAENNARNPLLIFARDHLAGRYGIPKYGDDVEYPLTPTEVGMLRKDFTNVVCEYPTLIFIRKLNTYVFRGKEVFKPIMTTLDRIDDSLWKAFPRLRQFSYNQIVYAEAPKSTAS